MVKNYCRRFLCFYLSALIIGTVNFSFAHDNNSNKSFNLYSKDGTRTVERKNQIVLNHQLDIPEFYSIDTEIHRMLSRWKVKGAAIAIAKDGKIMYTKGYGYADYQNKVKMQPDHLFRIASASKLITATAIFQLIEKGKLTLDTPVFGENGILDDSIYTSQIKDKRVENITVRHLMNHTGGWVKNNLDVAWLPDFKLDAFLPGPYNLRTKLISLTLKQGLSTTPGRKSEYSNVSYIMLGEVIERLSGESYYSYIKRNILEPLQISDIFPGRSFKENKYADETLYYDVVGAKKRTSVIGQGLMVPGPYGGANIELLGPSGGLVGTVRELLKLVLALDGFDDAPDILSRESIAEMTIKHSTISPMGWAGVSEDRWWRTGTLTGTSALLVRKSDGISYSVLVNTTTTMYSLFTSEIHRIMEKGLSKVTNWPNPNTVFPSFAQLERMEPDDIQSIDHNNLINKDLFPKNLAMMLKEAKP